MDAKVCALGNLMKMRTGILLLFVLIGAGFVMNSAASGATAILRAKIGKRVTLRGTFSDLGKLGPFILVEGTPIYILAIRDSDVPAEQALQRFRGAHVVVTGVLRFQRAPVGLPDTVAQPRDHYFFDVSGTKVSRADSR